MRLLMTLLVVASTMVFFGPLVIVVGVAYLFMTYVYKPATDGSNPDIRFFLIGVAARLRAIVEPFIEAGKKKDTNPPEEGE